jgi:hypothetical protein
VGHLCHGPVEGHMHGSSVSSVQTTPCQKRKESTFIIHV